MYIPAKITMSSISWCHQARRALLHKIQLLSQACHAAHCISNLFVLIPFGKWLNCVLFKIYIFKGASWPLIFKEDYYYYSGLCYLQVL